jgi:hypothetical protein
MFHSGCPTDGAGLEWIITKVFSVVNTNVIYFLRRDLSNEGGIKVAAYAIKKGNYENSLGYYGGVIAAWHACFFDFNRDEWWVSPGRRFCCV